MLIYFSLRGNGILLFGEGEKGSAKSFSNSEQFRAFSFSLQMRHGLSFSRKYAFFLDDGFVTGSPSMEHFPTPHP